MAIMGTTTHIQFISVVIWCSQTNNTVNAGRGCMIRWVGQLLRRVSRRMNRPPVLVKLGIRTRNPHLYEQATRHISAANTMTHGGDTSYERLEFLGDAVLDCVIAEHLYDAFSDENEGFLTALRAKLVSKSACAQVARSLDLGSIVQLSAEFERDGGRASDSILADCLEALIGAVYLDMGMAQARAFVNEHMLSGVDLQALAERESNFKSALQEYAQAQGLELPCYHFVSVTGPARRQIFTIEVALDGETLGTGRGRTKKKAQQRAAQEALTKIRSGSS